MANEVQAILFEEDEFCKIKISHYMELYRKAQRCDMIADTLRTLLTRMDHINTELESLILKLEGEENE